MSEKYFTIDVQGSPNNSNVYEGILNKDAGVPEGDTVPVKLLLGALTIPNLSRVWGHRVKDKKTNLPNGDIQFMEWGTDGGEVVEIRFLPNSSSLDKHYQDNVQKLKPADDDLELRLKIGLNDFDPTYQKPLIEMIKHHTFNGDNKSRDPQNKTVKFYLHDGASLVKSKTAEIKLRNEAEAYVLNAVETRTITVLAAVFGLDLKNDESTLEKILFEKVEENFKQFLDVIADHKTNLHAMLRDAEIEGVLSGTNDGEVAVREDGKNIPLLDVLEFKQIGDSPADFLISNFLDEDVYNAISKVSGLLDRYKQLVLN